MENAGYLFAAYGVVWAVVFGYVLVLQNRQRRLRREINSLKETLKERKFEQQGDRVFTRGVFVNEAKNFFKPDCEEKT